jgi:fucose permease
VTLLGAWFFAHCDARRFFPASIAIAALGAFALIMAEGFVAYLVGVALFAAGYANVYGFVYAVAAPRHPSGKAASVAALLTMSIAGGALASPLIAAMSRLGARSAEVLSVAATAVLLLLAALARRSSGRCA